MKKGNLWRNGVIILSLIVALGAFRASAGPEVDVGVSYFNGLTQDSVDIVVGMSVFWFDADPYGPYTIHSETGAWPDFQTEGYVLFTQTGTYYYDDGLGDLGTVNVTANIPPSVTITNPANNAVLSAPATFDFAAAPSDTDADGISDVEFYIGTNLVDDVFSDPFTTSVTNLPAGNYTLSVIAYDWVGATATDSITITVGNSTPITLGGATISAGKFFLNASGLSVGKTNILQTTTNLSSSSSWVALKTNIAASASASFTNSVVAGRHFFRVVQLP